LDGDLPVWNIANYTPLDEGAYAMQAIQNVNPQTVYKINQIDSDEFRQWNSSMCLMNTMFNTVTLKLFGDNYYGLRLSLLLFLYLY